MNTVHIQIFFYILNLLILMNYPIQIHTLNMEQFIFFYFKVLAFKNAIKLYILSLKIETVRTLMKCCLIRYFVMRHFTVCQSTCLLVIIQNEKGLQLMHSRLDLAKTLLIDLICIQSMQKLALNIKMYRFIDIFIDFFPTKITN